MAQPKNRRKQTLVDLDLQFKVVFVSLLAACLVLLINFQLSLASVWSAAEMLAGVDTVEQIVTELKRRVFREFAISLALGIPVAGVVGLFYSFKFCGPLYRIRQHLESMIRGGWRHPCMLRKGDDLKEVARLINESASLACDYADDVHDLLQEVRAALDGIEPEDDTADERLCRIRERIVREEEAYAKHFGEAVAIGGASPRESVTA